MENYVFLHGSSVGQSSIIPPNCPLSICKDIADKYFQGRIPRQKESDAKIALFVDLYQGASGDNYSLYSFVNNECVGANGREGQYLSISILCKGYYVFPELVYNMLSSAYNQMYAKDKIIRQINNKDQYLISQFSEEENYLLEFLRLIEKAFSSFANNSCNRIDGIKAIADYDSWKGYKVNLENCNSISAFNNFCNTGRIYISKEYKSPAEKIKSLEGKIQEIERSRNELENKQVEESRKEKSKFREEIEDQRLQLERQNIQLKKLQEDNDNYIATIETVRKEIDKFAKASNRLERRIEIKPKPHQDGFWSTFLLILILIVTVISCILNYCFFRNLSPYPENEKGEMTPAAQTNIPVSKEPEKRVLADIFEISQSSIDAPATQQNYQITVTSNTDWSIPSFDEFPWLNINKTATGLSVRIKANNSNQPRSCTFMITSLNGIEKQVVINQKGKEGQIQYGIIVKDSEGNVLTNGSTVFKGQVLNAYVEKPSMAANGFGWTYYKCEGPRKNNREINFTITGDVGETAVIGYGDLNQSNQRQKFKFTIVDNSGSEAPKDTTLRTGQPN